MLQIENDYAVQDKWQSYVQNNDKKDSPKMASNAYDKNEGFFIKMFFGSDMLKQLMNEVGVLLYNRLKDK